MSLFLADWYRRVDWLFGLVDYFHPIPGEILLRNYYVMKNDSPQWHEHVVDIYALSAGSCDPVYRFHDWSILICRMKQFVSSNFRQLLVILGGHRPVVELDCLLCLQPSTENFDKSLGPTQTPTQSFKITFSLLHSQGKMHIGHHFEGFLKLYNL